MILFAFFLYLVWDRESNRPWSVSSRHSALESLQRLYGTNAKAYIRRHGNSVSCFATMTIKGFFSRIRDWKSIQAVRAEKSHPEDKATVANNHQQQRIFSHKPNINDGATIVFPVPFQIQ